MNKLPPEMAVGLMANLLGGNLVKKQEPKPDRTRHELDSMRALIPEVSGCQRCGQCCGFVPMLKCEWEQIEAHLFETGKDDLVDTYNEWVAALLEKAEAGERITDLSDDDWTCPFFSKDTGCEVYPVRPIICRLFGALPKSDPRMKCPNGSAADNPISKGKHKQVARWLRAKMQQEASAL